MTCSTEEKMVLSALGTHILIFGYRSIIDTDYRPMCANLVLVGSQPDLAGVDQHHPRSMAHCFFMDIGRHSSGGQGEGNPRSFAGVGISLNMEYGTLSSIPTLAAVKHGLDVRFAGCAIEVDRIVAGRGRAHSGWRSQLLKMS